MFNHPVSDLVSLIKNGYMAKKESVISRSSKLKESLLLILKEEGYVLNYSKMKNEEGFNVLNINLRYSSGIPAVSEIKVISKPGRKVYSDKKSIPVIKNGLGIVILSTHKGLMSDYEAKSNGLGGELLLKVF
jgi:small subunit ribosomal protein S8